MHRLQSVSGGGSPDKILQQLESQRDFKLALQAKLAETEQKKNQLEEAHVTLVKQRETLLEEAPDRGSGASARMSEQILRDRDELRRKNVLVERQAHSFVRVNLLLVEAKDAMRRMCFRLSGVPVLCDSLHTAVRQRQCLSQTPNRDPGHVQVPSLSSDETTIPMLLAALGQQVPALMEHFVSLVPVQLRHAHPTEKRPWLPSVSRERSFESIRVDDMAANDDTAVDDED